MTPDPSWPLVAAGAILAGIAVAALRHLAPKLPQDRPGQRSLHHEPVPRVGGIAIWAGFLPIALLAPPALPGPPWVWLAATGGVAAVSLADDYRGVHPVARLAVHLAAAAAVAAAIVDAGPAPAGVGWWAAATAAAIMLVWAANLYNFMDGSDGLAGAMAGCGFAAYGLAAWWAGAPATAFFALAAATVPFLVVNLPPARMFMGDVGSVPLGFLAAGVGLAGWRSGAWPAWFPLLVFMPFVADATLTLGWRIRRRERIWEAHSGHYYQRLNRLGAGHRGTLLAFGALMLGTGASALAALALAPGFGWGVTAAWGALMAVLFCGIDYHWQHRTPAHR